MNKYTPLCYFFKELYIFFLLKFYFSPKMCYQIEMYLKTKWYEPSKEGNTRRFNSVIIISMKLWYKWFNPFSLYLKLYLFSFASLSSYRVHCDPFHTLALFHKIHFYVLFSCFIDSSKKESSPGSSETRKKWADKSKGQNYAESKL